MKEFIENNPLLSLYAVSTLLVAIGICIQAASIVPFFVVTGVSGLFASLILAVDHV